MRTTVMLPPDLMRAAKARAAEGGESLKTLLTRAVEVELLGSARPSPRNRRVTLPLFGGDGPSVAITNAELEQALADEDATAVRRRR